MLWYPTLTDLRTILATLYPTVDDARRVVVDAGLNSLTIAFDAKAILNWQHILEEALRCNRIGELLQVVRLDYPENTNLAYAEQVYRTVSGQTTLLPDHLFFEPETVLIPAGPFWMGSRPGPGVAEHEIPQHAVYLSAYRIGRFPVTNAQYAEFVRQSGRLVAPELGWAGQRPMAGQEQHPVSGVTWYEALAYCAWLSQATGRTYTLPNEAQWEKEARGVDGHIYPWGNVWETGRCNLGASMPTAVDHFPAQSVYGGCDLVGNGREWTSSHWGERLAAPELRYRYPWHDDERNDLSANDQIRRIWRGSASSDPQRQCRCAARGAQLPTSRGGPQTRFGFRVVMKV